MKMKHAWTAAFLLAISAASVFADKAEIGKVFPAYQLEDQFGNATGLAPDTRFVIIASEKGVSGRVNEWLKGKGQEYLTSNKVEYVSDIEPMPEIITRMFALPKMKKYPFTLILNKSKEFAQVYPSEKGKIAVFVLDAKQILTGVHFVDTAADVEALIAK